MKESLLKRLRAVDTPTVCNAIEVAQGQRGFNAFTRGTVLCSDPAGGAIVGFARTARIAACRPSDEAPEVVRGRRMAYYRYMSEAPRPGIAVIEDLDKPRVIGSFWGEVNSNTHRALGCVGTITDGAIRDVDEMCNAGFKALAQRLCVGHAHVVPVEWNVPVEVFGTGVEPGQLIHADKHGFLVIPEEDQAQLLEAARFMDSNECQTVIAAARSVQGLGTGDILKQVNEAGMEFSRRVRERYEKDGEW